MRVELILDLIDFDRRAIGADLVVAGEGSLDEQALAGNAPIGVARAAAGANVRMVAVAGRLQLSPAQLRGRNISGVRADGPGTRLRPLHRERESPAAQGGTDCKGLAHLDSENGQQRPLSGRSDHFPGVLEL
jgi:hypothetical protein